MPKYFRIKQTVLERIARGAWTPGAMIPSEVELCREFGVSRTTARKAVSDLAYEGRLVVVQGKGTFVAAPKVEWPVLLVGLAWRAWLFYYTLPAALAFLQSDVRPVTR